jgi:hypothetical protein
MMKEGAFRTSRAQRSGPRSQDAGDGAAGRTLWTLPLAMTGERGEHIAAAMKSQVSSTVGVVMRTVLFDALIMNRSDKGWTSCQPCRGSGRAGRTACRFPALQ